MRAIGLVFLFACASSIDAYPYHAQLYVGASPHFRGGTVVEKRADGFLLFKFDDVYEGDHGFMWIDPEDNRYRLIRRVAEPTLIPAPADASQRSPDSPWRPPQ